MKASTRASLLLCTAIIPLVLAGFAPVNAQFSNLVCIAESSSASCPFSPPSFIAPVGGQLTVAVNVYNAEAINGFDIITVTNPAVLQPVSNGVAGFLFEGQPNLIVANTVDPVAGTSRVAAVIFGALTTPPTTGRLFATTYNVVGPGAGIVIGFQQTILTNPDPITVTVQTATFSSFSDFAISAAQTSLSVSKGSTVSTTVTLSSLGGFVGDVILTASVSPLRRNGPVAGLSPSTVSLVADGSALSTLTITTERSTFRGSYTVTVTGTAGALSHSVAVSLTVTR